LGIIIRLANKGYGLTTRVLNPVDFNSFGIKKGLGGKKLRLGYI
jgi:hypothetical protein